MSRFVSRIAPLLLPACIVDTPVVDSPDSGVGSDRLGANLGAWCDSLCARLDVCGEARDDCVTDCIQVLSEGFANKNDTCTDAGLRAMDCMEQASCAELTAVDSCSFQEEYELCLASRDLVSCTAGGGNEGGTSGRAGSGFSCDALFEDCSNGSVYRLACDGPGDPPECSCIIDEEVVGRFIPSRLECPDTRDVARICGWPIVEEGREPTYPIVRNCEDLGRSGFSGGVPTGDCRVSFTKCSNGHSYAVECHDTAPGVVDCTCLLDGEEYDSYQSAAGICPFVADLSDGGTVATNYACGFNLSTVPVAK